MFPKRGPVKAGYRIKQTAGKKLEPIQPSKSMPVNKLKPHLRYSGEQQPVQQKTVLLNTIIEEHLLKFGLIESFDTFIKEVAEKSMVSLSDITKVESLKEIQDKVLDSFRKGNDKVFFASWQKLVSRKKLASPGWAPSPELEFKIRAFMTIYHLNPHSGSKVSDRITKLTDEDFILNDTMRRIEDFKQYLASNVSEFMDNPDYTNYFNIPFILSTEGDRQSDYQEFFELAWSEGVTSDLTATLESAGQQEDGEEHGTQEASGTQLEQILLFFMTQNARGGEGEGNSRWETVEMQAEEAAASIETQKQANQKKMAELSNLAHKYEGLKVEYESYLGQLEDKSKTDLTILPGTLIVENKSRQKAIDERDKHEAETLKNTQKDLGKKFNAQETRLFKNHYNEKFGNYKLLTFNSSKMNLHLNEVERLWRRVLFEHSYACFTYANAITIARDATKPAQPQPTENKKDGAKDASKKPDATKPTKIVTSEDIDRKKSKITVLEAEFGKIKASLNIDPDALTKFFRDVEIVDTPGYDKKYKLEDAYIESCITITKEDLTKPKVAAQTAKDLKADPVKEDAKPGDQPKTDDKAAPADPKNDGQSAKTSDSYSEDLHERTCISLSVLNQKLIIGKPFVIPSEELFFEQICLNVEHIVKGLVKKSPQINENLERELDYSLCFLLKMSQIKLPCRERLRKLNFMSNLFLVLYNYVENKTKTLAEGKRLTYYTNQVLKSTRLVLESYREYPQNLPKSFENFVQLYSSKANFEIPAKSALEVDWLLISSVALSSKQAGELMEAERVTLARIIVEENYKQYPEKIPMALELAVEASLVVLAALGCYQRLGQFKGVKELLTHLEGHPVFNQNKALLQLNRTLNDTINGLMEPEQADNLLDDYLAKLTPDLPASLFNYDTDKAELLLWRRDKRAAEAEYEMLIDEVAKLDQELDAAKQNVAETKANKLAEEQAKQLAKEAKEAEGGKKADEKASKNATSEKSKKTESEADKKKKK